MAGDWDEFCVICASRGPGAALRILQERCASDAAPPTRTPLEALALCRPCSEFVAETLRACSGGLVPLGGGPQLSSDPARTAGAECGHCAAPVERESFIV